MNKEPSNSMSLKCVYTKDGGGLCIGHRGRQDDPLDEVKKI